MTEDYWVKFVGGPADGSERVIGPGTVAALVGKIIYRPTADPRVWTPSGLSLEEIRKREKCK